MTKKERLLLFRLHGNINEVKKYIQEIDSTYDQLFSFLDKSPEFQERIGNMQVCPKCLYSESKSEFLHICPACDALVKDEYNELQGEQYE